MPLLVVSSKKGWLCHFNAPSGCLLEERFTYPSYRWLSARLQYLRCYNALTKLQYYNDVIMSAIASQITSLTIVYSTIYSDADQRKHQSSASLAFVRGIHRGPVNSPHKWPVTRKMSPFNDVIMSLVLSYRCIRKLKKYEYANVTYAMRTRS